MVYDLVQAGVSVPVDGVAAGGCLFPLLCGSEDAHASRGALSLAGDQDEAQEKDPELEAREGGQADGREHARCHDGHCRRDTGVAFVRTRTEERMRMPVGNRGVEDRGRVEVASR